MSNPYDQNPSDPNQSNPYGQSDPNQANNPYGQPDPNPYAQPAYGAQPTPYAGAYGAAPQPHPQGTAVLVLGILGLVLCGICGIVALVMGGKALKEIDANPTAYSNRQSVVIGRILGIIAIALWGLLIVVYGIIFIAAFASGGFS